MERQTTDSYIFHSAQDRVTLEGLPPRRALLFQPICSALLINTRIDKKMEREHIECINL